MKILSSFTTPVKRLKILFILAIAILMLLPARGVCQDFSDEFSDGVLSPCWQVGTLNGEPVSATLSSIDIDGNCLQLSGVKTKYDSNNNPVGYYGADMIVFGGEMDLEDEVTIIATFKADDPNFYTHYGIALGNASWTDTVQLSVERIILEQDILYQRPGGACGEYFPPDKLKTFIVLSDEMSFAPAEEQLHSGKFVAAAPINLSAYDYITLILKKKGNMVTGHYILDHEPEKALDRVSLHTKNPFGISVFAGIWPSPPDEGPEREEFFQFFEETILPHYYAPGSALAEAYNYCLKDFTIKHKCGVGECANETTLKCRKRLSPPRLGEKKFIVIDDCKPKPSSEEICDCKDNDCDGCIDECFLKDCCKPIKKPIIDPVLKDPEILPPREERQIPMDDERKIPSDDGKIKK